MASKPMQWSLALLRRNGWSCAIVEKWLPPRGNMKFGIRIDAYGFGDILACRPPGFVNFRFEKRVVPARIAMVQTTSQVHMSDHRAKILAEPRAWVWARSGGLIMLWGWKKRPVGGKRGAPKEWRVTQELIGASDFDGPKMERLWAAMQKKG